MVKKKPFEGSRYAGGRKPGVVNIPPMLKDMRWAYENLGNGRAGTVQQEGFRDDLVNDRKGFLARLDRLEREYEARQQRARERTAAGGAGLPPPGEVPLAQPATPGQPPAAAPLPDLGTQHCLDLVGRLIREWKEDAERRAGA